VKYIFTILLIFCISCAFAQKGQYNSEKPNLFGAFPSTLTIKKNIKPSKRISTIKTKEGVALKISFISERENPDKSVTYTYRLIDNYPPNVFMVINKTPLKNSKLDKYSGYIGSIDYADAYTIVKSTRHKIQFQKTTSKKIKFNNFLKI